MCVCQPYNASLPLARRSVDVFCIIICHELFFVTSGGGWFWLIVQVLPQGNTPMIPDDAEEVKLQPADLSQMVCAPEGRERAGARRLEVEEQRGGGVEEEGQRGGVEVEGQRGGVEVEEQRGGVEVEGQSMDDF